MRNLNKSLKTISYSYEEINKRLSHLQSGAQAGKGASGREAQAPRAERAARAADVLSRESTKLGTKLTLINGTLEVLQGVLDKQNISLDSLAKRPNAEKPSAASTESPRAPVVPPSSSSWGDFKPPARPPIVHPTPTETDGLVYDAANETGFTATAANGGNATQGWSSLASRLSGGSNMQPAGAAAASHRFRPSPEATHSPQAPPSSEASLSQKLSKRSKKESQPPIDVRTVRADDLELMPIQVPDMPDVPRLSYGLDRALFNPGVYQLQDPHSKVYNFDPYLAHIMPINEFDFNALKQYVTSSKDKTLISLASKLGMRYSGSTSSMTSTLAHFHYLLSSWRPVNTSSLSRQLVPDSRRFTAINRAPAATFVQLRDDGVYAIDADKEYDFASILSMLGKSMEKLLTLPKDEFERYRRKNSDQISEEERNAEEAFHYTTMGDFLMRSQLDAYDPRLPGTGMFDLKTRAVVSIRMDATGFQKGLGYEIRDRFGTWESFEREYYDMIRSAFMKYSLQVRMGRMDGIFVAFHNTQRIFGFQYITLNEMDLALHGTMNRALGDQEFKLSIHLLNKILDRATHRFPGRSIRLHVETRETNPPMMYIFAQPVEPEDIEKIQSTKKNMIAEYEKNILGLHGGKDQSLDPESEKSDADFERSTSQQESLDVSTQMIWEQMQEQVELAMEDDILDVDQVREAIQDALEQSGLLEATTEDEARDYVNALLDVLTRNQASESSADVDGQQSTVLERGTLSFETKGDDGSGTVVDRASGNQATSLGSNGATQSPLYRDSNLKELIRRVTAGIDENIDVDEDDASDESKLRVFGRVLSELVAKSRQSERGASTSAMPETEDPTVLRDHDVDDLDDTTSSTAAEDDDASTAGEVDDIPPGELLGMNLTVLNKVDGNYVVRPDSEQEGWDWTLEYSLVEMPEERTRRVYQSTLNRRRKAFDQDDVRDARWYEMFKGKLRHLSSKGRTYREKVDAEAKKEPVHVFGKDGPITWDEAFGHREQWQPQAWETTKTGTNEDEVEQESR
ncbi:mRNA degradation protein pet127 [Colletotrichum orbiculare MAFF 240422]|uniref:mRNA degradation protein pet127 n=1 Tax=Colletotrichum orbiculare (strain 104-T / ATCC 96160 / CBS 514.97 / LARS 414 / MAFF 240422) TaxID=1213857 RepID=A0A484FWH6_COLOR|nr:mRNA degradation protein pet127 [Colletotrichum orbiculare MAFF 240422]